MKSSSLNYRCRNCDCNWELDLQYNDIIPAKISGPPENCYPAEGGEVEVSNDECPQCGTEVDIDIVCEEFWDKHQDDGPEERWDCD